ncbi:MAG: GNAT family N-acetyltransferase [Promethearchaeota archaeon]
MSVEINLRRAEEDDLAFIRTLLEENGLPHEDIPSQAIHMFIGYVDSEVVGIGGVELIGKYGLLRSLVIETSFRGRGYGRSLSEKLIEYSKLNGVFELYALTSNADSIAKKIGFERIDRRDVPQAIQKTRQFTDLCALSAVCWRMRL